MYRGSRTLAAALLLFTAGSASAVELNYQWKKGDVHRFRYEDDSTLEMKMGGMGGMQMPGMNMDSGEMSVRMKVQSTFSQKVLAVRPDGTAQVELTLEKMDFVQGDQRATALDQIPPAARKVKAEVDRKGHAKFFRMVTLYVQEGRTVVGVHDVKVGPKGARASMSAGDTRVDVVAAVDPKTGSVSLAMQEKKVPPALKAVKVKQEDPSVDVLPKQIFEMMVLPDGAMETGGVYEVGTPMGTLATTLTSLDSSMAQLHTTVAQRLQASEPAAEDTRRPGGEAEGAAPASAPDMGGPNMGGPNMGGPNMGGPNMGGPNMGGPNMGPGAGSGPGSVDMKVDVDVTTDFDVTAGRLVRIEGTQHMNQDMGGMSGMKVDSRFSLQRL